MQDLYSAEIKTVAQNTSWPSPQDYNEAIQNPQFAFADCELKNSEPELNVIGLPKPASGNFASVYRLYSNDNEWAVRCFLQPMSDQQQRYEALSKKLKEYSLPYMCSFEYLSEGIRVHNNWFPIIKMEWVKGKSLLEYISENIDKTERLEQLADSFEEMILSLQSAGIAHGDLQHGNILVTEEGKIKLVDYDGCFVPELEERKSNELGHRNYQHPKRDANYFHSKMDVFSAQIIMLSLRAISHEPSLWTKLEAGDECLLFRRHDLIKPEYSRVFHLLEIQHDDCIKTLAKQVRYELGQELSELPSYGTITFNQTALAPLETVLVNTPESIAASKQNEHHLIHINGRKEKKAKTRENVLVSTVVIAIILGAVTLRQLSDQLADQVNQTIWTSTEEGTPVKSKRNFSNLLKVTEYNRAQIDGLADAETLFSNQETPRKLYNEAKFHGNREPKEAEEDYLNAIKLDSQVLKDGLSVEQRAEALQFVGMNRLRNNDASSTAYIEQACELLLAAGDNYAASKCMADYSEALLANGSNNKAYFQSVLALENPKLTSTFRQSLSTSATNAAIATFKAEPGSIRYKLKRIWDAISISNDRNLELTFLAQVDEFAEQLLAEKNNKAAYEMFGLIVSLSQANDFLEFRTNAVNRIKQLSEM